MKFRFVFVFLLFVVGNLYSQQLPLSSQFMFNKFLINPAATGSSQDLELRLASRKQWMGLDGSPLTNSISANKLLNNKNMGVGLSIFSDKYGPESRVGFKVTYSYILPLSKIKSNLAFGVAFHGFQYSIDYSQLVAYNAADPILQVNSESAFVADADFGIYLYNRKYSFGISGNQLIEMPLKIGGTEFHDNTMVRHYYVMGSYLISINDDFDLEPSALVKLTDVSPIQADINLRFIYRSKYWVSASYRTSKTFIGMIGFNYKNFIFGYSYDYSFNEMQAFQSGSHEFILGYNFGQRFMSSSLLNSIRTM